jgi:hypothetical protein
MLFPAIHNDHFQIHASHLHWDLNIRLTKRNTEMKILFPLGFLLDLLLPTFGPLPVSGGVLTSSNISAPNEPSFLSTSTASASFPSPSAISEKVADPAANFPNAKTNTTANHKGTGKKPSTGFYIGMAFMCVGLFLLWMCCFHSIDD